MRDLTLGQGTSLVRNLQRSLAWSKTQREVATLISASHPPDVVDNWREMRDNFDRDPSMPNPYEEAEQRTVSPFLIRSPLTLPSDVTIAELQKDLLKEARHTSNAADARSSSVFPGTFFQKAIEVEDRM